jgi:putative intracellular protease/amidase
MTHVLVVVARQYNGHELWTSLGVLQQRGHTFEVISTETLISDEVTGQRTRIKRTLDDVLSLNGFGALMFVSGNMADTEAYWHDSRTLAYVEEAYLAHLPIAAICCSVPTIRAAAKGKNVSFFPLVRSRSLLEEAGAILSTLTYCVDGNLVTAEHQMATQMWAEAFCDILEGKKHSIDLVDSGYVPRGHERKPIPGLEHLKEVAKKTGKRGFDDTDIPSE